MHLRHNAPMARILAMLAVCGTVAAAAQEPPLAQLPDFTLTDQDGAPFGREDLAGRVSVLYFFFSTCTGPCPTMNANMAELSRRFAAHPGVIFVGISVDPDTDTPERLVEYAAHHGGDTTRWRLLTGPIEEVNRIAETLMVQAADRPVFHSTRFILSGRDGGVLGYYPGTDPEGVVALEMALLDLVGGRQSRLPTVNALLNAIAACFLFAGWLAIRRMRDVILHRKMMIAAVVASAAFLASYLVYHAQYGSVPYHGEGLLRLVYFAILVPHIILAALMVPFIFAMLYYAFTRQFYRHKRLARWVWPVWMYVSATGVLIYLMLYHG